MHQSWLIGSLMCQKRKKDVENVLFENMSFGYNYIGKELAFLLAYKGKYSLQ